jgi:hypothetical protein
LFRIFVAVWAYNIILQLRKGGKQCCVAGDAYGYTGETSRAVILLKKKQKKRNFYGSSVDLIYVHL